MDGWMQQHKVYIWTFGFFPTRGIIEKRCRRNRISCLFLRRLYKNQSPKCQPFFCCWVVVWWWVCCLLFWKKSGHTETRERFVMGKGKRRGRHGSQNPWADTLVDAYTTWYSQSVAITQPVAVDQIRVRKLYIYAHSTAYIHGIKKPFRIQFNKHEMDLGRAMQAVSKISGHKSLLLALTL
jgi:hypothetical protein